MDEELQAQYEADPEYHANIVDHAESHTRRNTLTQKFRLGAKYLCAKGMWLQIEAKAGINEPTPLGKLLKIRQKEVQTLRKGQMTLEILITLLSEIDLDVSESNPLPTLQERASAGYGLALSNSLSTNATNLQSDTITLDVLIAACLVLSSHEYLTLCEIAPDEIDWDSIADRVHKEMACDTSIDGPALKKVIDQWGRIIIECCHSIPHRWTEGAEL